MRKRVEEEERKEERMYKPEKGISFLCFSPSTESFKQMGEGWRVIE